MAGDEFAINDDAEHLYAFISYHESSGLAVK